MNLKPFIMKSILPLMLALLSLNTMAQLSPLEEIHSNHYLFQNNQQTPQTPSQRAVMHKLDSTTSIQYDTWSTHWRDWSKSEFDYYPNGTLKSYTTATPQMIKEVLTFNTSGRITEHRYYQYVMGDWDSLQKTVFLYDTDNRQISDSTYVWNNTSWEPYGHTQIDYDLQGYVTKRTYFYKQTWQFEPISQLIFTHDNHGNVLSMENKQYINNAWEPRNYYQHTYDSDNRRIEYRSEYWDGAAYVPEYKEVFTYQNGNLTQLDMSYWQNGYWELSSYQTYQYNLLENNANIYLPGQYMYNQNKLVAHQLHATTGMGTIATVDSTTFHYSNVSDPNSIKEINSNNYQVVQNPVLNNLVLRGNKPTPTMCSIYNLSGQLMFQQPLTQLYEEIDVSILKTGIYIIQLNSGEANSSLRIFKQ